MDSINNNIDNNIDNSEQLSYSQQWQHFLDVKGKDFVEKYPEIITNMNALYINVFKIMDIAKEKNIPCKLNDISHLIPGFEEFYNMLKSDNENDSDNDDDNDNTEVKDEFDSLLDEMQTDIDLILEKGFAAFEEKTLNVFAEIVQEDKDFENLIGKINNFSTEIRNLHADNILANQSN